MAKTVKNSTPRNDFQLQLEALQAEVVQLKANLLSAQKQLEAFEVDALTGNLTVYGTLRVIGAANIEQGLVVTKHLGLYLVKSNIDDNETFFIQIDKQSQIFINRNKQLVVKTAIEADSANFGTSLVAGSNMLQVDKQGITLKAQPVVRPLRIKRSSNGGKKK